MTNKSPIVLAAGGTGGHIFPAESLAEELVLRGEMVVMITDKRFADYNSASYEGVIGTLPIHYIHAGSLGGSLVKKIKGGIGIIRGTLQARQLLKTLKPKAVVGFGGYPSFPTMLAATQLGLNTVIHEQNSVLGKANRSLCGRVKRIATTYPQTQRLPQSCEGKTVLTGNPVRAAIRALHHVPYPMLEADGTLRLLVVGGSQGAQVFSSVVPEAIRLLPESLRGRIRLDQQARAADQDGVKEAYKKLGMQVDVAPFFADIPARLAAAHLIISRAGASTVAELSCAGRPAVLVPYPQATDNHQYFNAQAIEDVGGGWLMPQEGFTAAALAARLEAALTLPSSLSKAAESMRSLGHLNAAKDLADMVLNLSAEADRNQSNPSSKEQQTSDSQKEKAA